MRCPFCGEEDTQVKDSRASEDGATIRRRRLCSSCGSRFTTFERIQLRDLIVIKRNGKKNPFDRDKLSKSLLMALRKRQTDDDAIERAINGIVRQLESRGDNDIHSKLIGELVMNALAQIDNHKYAVLLQHQNRQVNSLCKRFGYSYFRINSFLESPR